MSLSPCPRCDNDDVCFMHVHTNTYGYSTGVVECRHCGYTISTTTRTEPLFERACLIWNTIPTLRSPL